MEAGERLVGWVKREELEICMMSKNNRRHGWNGVRMWRTGGRCQGVGIRLEDFRGQWQCLGCEGDYHSIPQRVSPLPPLSQAKSLLSCSSRMFILILSK